MRLRTLLTTKTASLQGMSAVMVCTAHSRRPSTRVRMHRQGHASYLRVSSPSTTSPSSQLRETRAKTFPSIQTMLRQASTATCSKVQQGSSSKFCHLSRTVSLSARVEVSVSQISSSARELSSSAVLNSAISRVVGSATWAEVKALNSSNKAR